jgi:hypothetical protein
VDHVDQSGTLTLTLSAALGAKENRATLRPAVVAPDCKVSSEINRF